MLDVFFAVGTKGGGLGLGTGAGTGTGKGRFGTRNVSRHVLQAAGNTAD